MLDSRLLLRLHNKKAELDARRLFRERADGYYDRILTLPDSLEAERRSLSGRIDDLKSSNAQMRDVVSLERQRRDLPKSSEAVEPIVT